MDKSASDEPIQQELMALLFASGNPLSLEQIQDILQRTLEEVKTGIENLESALEKTSWSGLQLRRVENKYYLATKSEISQAISAYYSPEYRNDLSNASYETLAVVAYNQPCTRAQIEKVRGVNSDYAIQKLLEREWIEVSGQLEAPGRPSLFSCTEKFLQAFALTSIDDLPSMDLLMYDQVLAEEEALEDKKDKNL